MKQETTMKYKLLNQNMTSGPLKVEWTINNWKETTGEGNLCGPGWLHCYPSPLLAAFFNPIHGAFEYPRLFEVEIGGEEKQRGIKFGYTKMRITKELKLKIISKEKILKFSMLCALEIYGKEYQEFSEWSKKWLNREDNTRKSIFKVFRASPFIRRILSAAADSNDNDLNFQKFVAYSTEYLTIDLEAMMEEA